ncbi:MAG: hypothetical protein GYB67_06790 [Chloroflexi bacterium]|nr:hypothetical protein [Chloroflexota bacterium]
MNNPEMQYPEMNDSAAPERAAVNEPPVERPAATARVRAAGGGFQWHDAALASGIVWGLIIGGLFAFFSTRSTGRLFRNQLRESVSTAGEELAARVEAAVPADPVAESMAEGKAAARRRRAELSIDDRSRDDQAPAR